MFGGILVPLLISQSAQAQGNAPSVPAVTFNEKWTVLHLEKRASSAPKVIPTQSPLNQLFNFEFKGSQENQKFLLGPYESYSAWFIQDGYLQPVEPKNAAIKLGVAENFELQGILNATGPGGWFILLGWQKQNGYLLSSVTLKSSGSPWHLEEIKNGKGIPDTHFEFTRFEWKGDQRFRLSIKDKTLNMTVGKDRLLKDQHLTNFQMGDLIFGTYETPYGPKPLKIKSLRVRAK